MGARAAAWGDCLAGHAVVWGWATRVASRLPFLGGIRAKLVCQLADRADRVAEGPLRRQDRAGGLVLAGCRWAGYGVGLSSRRLRRRSRHRRRSRRLAAEDDAPAHGTGRSFRVTRPAASTGRSASELDPARLPNSERGIYRHAAPTVAESCAVLRVGDALRGRPSRLRFLSESERSYDAIAP